MHMEAPNEFNGGMVVVYSKTTGEKRTVPPHWLDDPTLGADLSLTPTNRAAAAAEATPRSKSDKNTNRPGDGE